MITYINPLDTVTRQNKKIYRLLGPIWPSLINKLFMQIKAMVHQAR